MDMSLPPFLRVALKEWAVVCAALAQGRQMLLLRKGGISEAGRQFAVEHREFLLFPTYLHQNAAMLKPEFAGAVHPVTGEPGTIELSAAATVTDIVHVQSRSQIDKLDERHIWTAPLIDMRFSYRPNKPLYLLLVRAWRLAAPITIENTVDYAGCVSWVPLAAEISTGGAVPAIADAQFEQQRQLILDTLAVDPN
jgi:hypothetical protein